MHSAGGCSGFGSGRATALWPACATVLHGALPVISRACENLQVRVSLCQDESNSIKLLYQESDSGTSIEHVRTPKICRKGS